MKTSVGQYRIIFLAITFVAHNVVGEIKNGYERDIISARGSLKALTTMLHERSDWSSAERRTITSKIDYVQSILTYYELTENLLAQFKIVAPELYHEIDTIRDKKGRSVDVYVKFIPDDASSVSAWGATYIEQVEGDLDGYLSSYGPLTVSVKIWVVNKALTVLAHEFGHVKYQVPNLASYVVYHKQQYTQSSTAGTIGHDTGDQSGRSAWEFEKLFQKSYARYGKGANKRFQSPVTLLSRIMKNSHGAI
jgi:hypothetical protein